MSCPRSGEPWGTSIRWYSTIEVGDTCVGIPPEIAHRVFDQFFTTKPVGRGTGQGLALAHALVHDHHGGNLDFASKPGVGTVFTVQLPIAGDG